MAASFKAAGSMTQLRPAVEDCEMVLLQADVHSPATTVREALYFSARCRLMGVNKAQLGQFVDQVQLRTFELEVCRGFWLKYTKHP